MIIKVVNLLTGDKIKSEVRDGFFEKVSKVNG
jgi:hypothetical protein